MRKNNLFIFLSLVLVLMITIPKTSYATSGENKIDAREVFPEDEVRRLEESIDVLEIEPDQKDTGEMKLRSSGEYPRRKGVILVTKDKYKGLIPTGHAAIIYSYSYVVESISKGVVTGKNNWYQTKETCYGVTVKGTTVAQDKQAANWCYNQKGKPYNFNYLDPYRRDKFYCSQLVYAAFLDNFNIDLNTSAFYQAVHPMELVNTNKTSLIYKK